MLNKMTLYYFDNCPYCERVFDYLASNQKTLESRNISQNQAFENELIEKGGRYQVPCLKIEVADATTWMYESLDIINYLKENLG